MTNLTVLPSAQRNPNPDLIEVLEDLLEQAHAGQIVGLAGAVVFYDGDASTVAATRVTNYSFVGALACCLSSLTAMMDQD